MKKILIFIFICLLSSKTFAYNNNKTTKITFEKNSYILSLENQKTLDSLMPKFLEETQQDYSANVKIVAYSDVDELNQDLSKLRAEVIKNYLISKNISPEKILAQNMSLFELMMLEGNLALYRSCKITIPSQKQFSHLKNIVINTEDFSPKDVPLNTPFLQYIKKYHNLVKEILYYVPREYMQNIESLDPYVAKIATYFTLKPEQIRIYSGSLSMPQQDDDIKPTQDVQIANILIYMDDNVPSDKIPYFKFQHNSIEISEEKKKELYEFAEIINRYPQNIEISCRTAINEDADIYLKRSENIKKILTPIIDKDKIISISEEYQQNNKKEQSDSHHSYISIVNRYPSLYHNIYNNTSFDFEKNSVEINGFTQKRIIELAETLKQHTKIKLQITLYVNKQEQSDVAKKRSEKITEKFGKQNINSDLLKYVFVDFPTEETNKYSRDYPFLSSENIPICQDEKIDLPNCIEEKIINKNLH